MFENIAVMILAGGYGTRLRSVVCDRPKVLAEVNGRPFLSYLLDQLDVLKLKSVIICSGYKGEMIAQTFKNRYKNQELIYSQERTPLGTAGALALALDLCSSEYLMIMNGDSFCDADLVSFSNWHCSKRADGSVLLTYMTNSKQFGFVKTGEDDRIEVFEEKGTEGSGWVNAGIYIFHRNIIASIPRNRMVSLEREIFPALNSKKLYGYRSYGPFIDIGTPESYKRANDFFNEKYGDSHRAEANS